VRYYFLRALDRRLRKIFMGVESLAFMGFGEFRAEIIRRVPEMERILEEGSVKDGVDRLYKTLGENASLNIAQSLAVVLMAAYRSGYSKGYFEGKNQ
jgi:hypothetical protein